jgi:membrane protease YdiL (CAAX protease family)
MNPIEIEFSWVEGDLVIVLPMMLCLIGFTTFWFVSKATKINDGTVKNVLFTKYLGLFTMGIVPATLALTFMPQYALADYGLIYNSDTKMTSLVAILILAALTMPLAFLSAKKPSHQVNYPQIREKNWTRSLVLKNSLGWSAYLLGYEFLFRGILLFPLVDALGVWPAVAINTVMYSATHIPKGLDETIGAAFLGVVLCLVTLITGTLWVAIVIHITMALTNSFSSIYHNPEMNFVK